MQTPMVSSPVAHSSHKYLEHECTRLAFDLRFHSLRSQRFNCAPALLLEHMQGLELHPQLRIVGNVVYEPENDSGLT